MVLDREWNMSTVCVGKLHDIEWSGRMSELRMWIRIDAGIDRMCGMCTGPLLSSGR